MHQVLDLIFQETNKLRGYEKKKVRNLRQILTQYPDRESNSELSFRRALLYPFNYQGKTAWKAEECKYRLQRYEKKWR